MLNVVHIHSNPAFLNETDRVRNPGFENTVVLLDGERAHVGAAANRAELVSRDSTDLAEVARRCSAADVVVLYDLDYAKASLALRLPPSVFVAWRFFGYELYGRRMKEYLSPSSQRYFQTGAASRVLLAARNKIGGLLSSFRRRESAGSVFENAVKRADAFLGLSRNEYHHLAGVWENLPPFVQLPLAFDVSPCDDTARDNLVVVGNSRNIYNNHLDVIDLIETARYGGEVSFLIPFSYGEENAYTKEVRRRVQRSRKKIVLLENLMAPEAYFRLVTRARAGVSNSFRQLGMGNIFEFLNAGVKVYLNPRNVIHSWLRDLGLKVFTIEDFESDLRSGSLDLSPEDREANGRALGTISSRFSSDGFFAEISAGVRNKGLSLARR